MVLSQKILMALIAVWLLPGCVVGALFEDEPLEATADAADSDDAVGSATSAGSHDHVQNPSARQDPAGSVEPVAAPTAEEFALFAFQADQMPAAGQQDLRRPCLDLFPGRTGEALRACRGPDQVQIQAQGRMHVLARPLLQARARDLVQAMLFQQKLLVSDLGETRLDLWLTAPPLNANAPGWTLVVWTAAGAWRINLPFDLDAWRLDPEQIAIVSREGYPSRGSWRPGRILLQAHAHITPQRFAQFIQELGIGTPKQLWPVAVLDVRWFHERAAVKAIKQHVAYPEFVAFLQPQYSAEPDRVRRLFDRFALKPQ